jgi:hypothetical protein
VDGGLDGAHAVRLVVLVLVPVVAIVVVVALAVALVLIVVLGPLSSESECSPWESRSPELPLPRFRLCP